MLATAKPRLSPCAKSACERTRTDVSQGRHRPATLPASQLSGDLTSWRVTLEERR